MDHTLLTDIYNGEYDAHLEEIAQACLARRKALGVDNYGGLQPGDRVMVVGTDTGSKYLNGKTGTVKRRLYVNLEVQLDEEAGRFGSLIRLAPGKLQPIAE